MNMLARYDIFIWSLLVTILGTTIALNELT